MKKSCIFNYSYSPWSGIFLLKKTVEFGLVKTTKSVLLVKFQWSLVEKYAVGGYVVVKI